MLKAIYCLLLCNVTIFYLYSISNIFLKFCKFKSEKINKIILGYSIFIVISYNLYFTLSINPLIINIFFLVTALLLSINIKKYFKSFFLTKKNYVLNLIILLFLLPPLIYGEQFYIFRGNYWDSSNYLSSAILFKDLQYSEIISGSFPQIFLEFQSIEYITKARPMANYLLSIFLNDYFSFFFTFYSFKLLITLLIFLSLITFLEDNFNLKNLTIIITSFVFVISFWNIYIFEIDALSHLTSVPILILTIHFLFKIFNDLNNKENYFIIVLLASALFIVYPEISIIVLLVLFILLLDNIKFINKKVFKLFLFSFLFFILLTATSYETNYKHLISSQLGNSIRSNDWWGYFGSFIFGKNNLVLDNEFVSSLKLILDNNLSNKDIIKFIHTQHFENDLKFIYLNIIPSISGLYFLTIGKLANNYLFYFQVVFFIFLLVYLLKIAFKNIIYLLSNPFSKYKFLYFVIINIFFFLFFLKHNSYWSIIKFYTYFFPFLFLFFALDFKKIKINYLYIFLVSTFVFYKYSVFNNGIGRYDSFPSIINPIIKKEIQWEDISYKKLHKCRNISIEENNYIIKAYLNLKLIDLGINKNKNQNCKIYLENKKFEIVYEQ